MAPTGDDSVASKPPEVNHPDGGAEEIVVTGSPIRKIVGAIWGSPQELIGGIYGGLNWITGGKAQVGRSGVIWYNSPIQRFLGGQNSAITFGHSMVLADQPGFVLNDRGDMIADHEEQHTYQSEILGPLHLPAAGLSLLLGTIFDGNSHGPHSFMETGPQSSPPRPW